MSFSLDQLRHAAYKTELVLCRRLMRNNGMTEHAALMQVLERNGLPLAQLLAQREQGKADGIAKKAARQQQKDEALAQKRSRDWVESAASSNPALWLAWFDGSARPNPGRLGIGGVLRHPDGQLFEHCAAAGHGDSNEAEYLALIAVLEMALQLNAAPLIVCGDSRW
jgi:ribonuclease HI